jgi:putative transcriptional regulator
MAIRVNLGKVLRERQMTLVELAERTGITVNNLSILKNGKGRAIRFSTLSAICEVLDCQPGHLLEFVSDEQDR